MSLKNKLQLYVCILHLFAFATALYFYKALGLWLFALEMLLALSFLIGLKLVNSAMEPFHLIQTFSDILKQADFSARLAEVGHAELDSTIQLYNQMLTELYDERLRVGEQRGIVEKLLNASPAAVIIFDFDKRISLINPAAEQLLYTTNKLALGKPLRAIDTKLAVISEKMEVNEARLVSLTNGDRLRLQKALFQDRGFERQFMLIEELTKEVEATEKSTYEKLIPVMSHEVNNTVAATNSLLSSCLNYSSQLKESDQEDFSKALTVVIKRNQSLNLFMQAYSSVVRLPEPEFYPVDLKFLLKHITAMYSPQLTKKNIQLKIISPQKPVTIYADANLLEQALMNIVKNAMEAVISDGQITIEIRQGSSEVNLEIRDTGPGISTNLANEIFTPFFTTKKDGQGLGLMLIREIFKAQRFRYALSNTENSGACFQVVFPLSQK